MKNILEMKEINQNQTKSQTHPPHSPKQKHTKRKTNSEKPNIALSFHALGSFAN